MATKPPADPDGPPEDEWFELRGDATEVDKTPLPAPRRPIRDPITAPHPITGEVAAAFEKGRQQGISEGIKIGQDDAVDALRRIIVSHFGPRDESMNHLVGKLKKEMTRV